MTADPPPSAGRAAPPPTSDGAVAEPPGPFGTLEADLADLETRLGSDLSREGALAAFHRLLALVSLANDRPVGAIGTLPAPVSPTRAAAAPGAAPPPADGTGRPAPGPDVHLGRIAAALHRIVEIVAERVGATGYSIGVSLPAGISITVDFTIPAPPRSTTMADAVDKGI